MSLNSLTYPLQYEDLRPKTDPESRLISTESTNQ